MAALAAVEIPTRSAAPAPCFTVLHRRWAAIRAAIFFTTGRICRPRRGSASSRRDRAASVIDDMPGLSRQTLSLTAAGPVTQTTSVTAANLVLLGSSGSYVLTNSRQRIDTLAAIAAASRSPQWQSHRRHVNGTAGVDEFRRRHLDEHGQYLPSLFLAPRSPAAAMECGAGRRAASSSTTKAAMRSASPARAAG